MTESILKALMRLFAIVAQVHPENKSTFSRSIVEAYLLQFVNPARVNQYLIMFDFYHGSLREREIKTGQKQGSLFSVKAIIICEQINKVLDKRQKLLVLMQLLEIINLKEQVPEVDVDFVRTIAIAFKFDDHVFQSCKSFIIDSLPEVPYKEAIIVIDGKKDLYIQGIGHIHKNYLKGKINFLSVDSISAILFRNTEADDKLIYKGKQVIQNRTYYFEKGSTLKNPIIGSIYYSEVVKEFQKSKVPVKINFSAEEVEFRFPNSTNGVHSFTLYEESGHLIGIMGGSGVGKSTLLNLMNGTLKPRKGRIMINGADVHYEKKILEGIIGFIPQDDLLIDELTVYENIYFNARLCFSELSLDEIVQRVHKILYELDLFEVQHLKVGNALNKFISGGQRKRVNIAMELIREPYVLFVDEPTSGLSSTDSSMVIDLLKEQSHKGKLVIVNIHQPSSDIFKRFDRLIVMDKGGRMVFHGNPADALLYFKSENRLINADDGECPTCGNVSPEQILQILEARKVNEYGDYIDERQITAEEWYLDYKKKLQPSINAGAALKSDIPPTDFHVPSRKNQLKIFTLRNLLTKISDKQYLLINLLEAPLLAFILGWICKFNAGVPGDLERYIFSENINLPVYLFMSIIVSLFLGLMLSSEEIIRDRRLLKRELFLNLSQLSYFNSKIILLFAISLVQTAIYVWIGNSILEIKGMFFPYWIILLSTSLLANLIGLNISATMKSVVSIYILIPLLLVPQILLGGAMIRFEKLNSKLSHPKYVPMVGDLMASRWAYEALAVYQFRNNDYEKRFFDIDKISSTAAYQINYLLPELLLRLNETERNIKANQNYFDTQYNLILLRNEVGRLSKDLTPDDSVFINYLSSSAFSFSIAGKTRTFLEKCKRHYSKKLDESIEKKDAELLALRNELGGTEQLVNYRQQYFNNSLEEIVLNKHEPIKIVEYKGQIIRKDEPIYKKSEMILGRSHFFAPDKKFLFWYFNTYYFNLMVILGMIFIFYLTLITALFPRIIKFFEIYNSGFVSQQIKSLIKPVVNPLLKNYKVKKAKT